MKVIPLQSEQNATIYLEVDEDFQVVAMPPSKLGGSVAGGSDVQNTFGRLQHVSATIAEVCRSIYLQVEKGLDAISPNELVMEFGVKLGGEAGVPCITKLDWPHCLGDFVVALFCQRYYGICIQAYPYAHR